MPDVAQREPFGDVRLQPFDALLLLQHFIVLAAVLHLIGQVSHQPVQRTERTVEHRLRDSRVTHAHDRARGQDFLGDEIKKEF